MDFLDSVDSHISEGVDDVVVETITTKPTVKRSNKRKRVANNKKHKKAKISSIDESTVSLLESRLRKKLDTVGLNDSIISSVVEYVFSNTTHTAKLVETQTPHTTDGHDINTVMGRAGSILEGVYMNDDQEPQLMESGSAVGNPMNDAPIMSDLNLDNVKDHASALLM